MGCAPTPQPVPGYRSGWRIVRGYPTLGSSREALWAIGAAASGAARLIKCTLSEGRAHPQRHL